MPGPSALTSQVSIKLDGTDVQRPVMSKLVSLTVDQHSHLPDMFTIHLRDPGLELLDNGPFDLTKEVEISAETPDGENIVLMTGKITALEPRFEEGMIATMVVRGFDHSHHLFRETKSQAFLNTKDSELANNIAQTANLQTEIETTSTVYDHIFQHNQSDLAFLQQRAWRIGFECFVQEDILFFRSPPSGSSGVTLTWGKDLLSFQPRMTLAEQVDEVVVKGWDVDQQAAIVGRATSGNLYPEVQESRDGASWASSFGTGKTVIVDHPVVSQAEADILAAARLDEISGAFIDAEGVARRRPDVKAGQTVCLEGLGERFSGTYLVTSATHTYSSQGLQTMFNVKGTRTGLLSEQLTHQKPLDRWPGVVTALVTDTDDPNDWGRVKLKFPWMTEDADSDWARVMGPGAGNESGLFFLPEVGNEVLVSFAHGDFSQPYVIGGLWNGQNSIPPEPGGAGSGEKPLVLSLRSIKGHRIAFFDTSDDKIEIETAGGHNITLDDANQKITITSSGGLTITLDDGSSKISLESSNEIEITASGNLTIQAGGNLDLLAGGQVNVTGTMINLNS